ncbi:alpha/beta fold hydrolase [Novosphingobium aquimarinum]|uniref:alpha/beta fold hydrolase n=1 Tax=Novosphingobium aquimarinum TaxID=2682494 RepID=UPI001E484C10|nr:alpha/beta hydrolase [Novosphingobium aquimarinum]
MSDADMQNLNEEAAGNASTAPEAIVGYVGAGGVQLVATRYGPDDGAPILLLHGGGQTRGSWRVSARRMAEQGFAVTALDMRGHGDSDWTPGGGYTMDLFADDVRAVIAEFDRPPLVGGASLGGLASLLALGEAPQAKVAGLVLVDIVPWIEPSGGEQVVGFMRGTSDGFDTLEEAADAIADYLPHRPRPERLDGLSRNLRQRADGRWYWHWDPSFVRPQEGWDLDRMNERLSNAARAIDAPMLLLHGTKSEIVTADGAERFAKILPKADVIPIEGAHHMVAGDDNDAFIDAMLPFLKRNAA